MQAIPYERSDVYEIRQFRPLLLLLVGLGFTGFAVATLSPGVWMAGVSALVLNEWLVRTGRYRPLPRWAAGAATVLLAAFAILRGLDEKPIVPIGEFLLFVQIVKLFERRTNRDYYQILTLSWLLVVAAMVSTSSLLFGLIGIAYLLMAPYVALLFHLKTEADFAKRQLGLDERRADPTTLRQDQRFLGRSMKRLTTLIAVASIALAIATFLFFPRGSVVGGLLDWQIRPPMATSGMSDSIQMDSVARVQQNPAQVGSVKITRNGTPVDHGEIYLRGTVYDVYDTDPTHATAWSWLRRKNGQFAWFLVAAGDGDTALRRPDAEPAKGDEIWTADFQPLQPINVPFLLAIGDPDKLRANSTLRMAVSRRDNTLALNGPLTQPLQYAETSSLPIVANVVLKRAADWRPGGTAPAPPTAVTPSPPTDAGGPYSRPPIEPGGVAQAAPPTFSPEVQAYARRPEVSGADADGRPLVDTLARQLAASPPRRFGDFGMVRLGRAPESALEIAQNIERHLQSAFQYTLDLQDDAPPRDGQTDPIVRFLYTTKRGWCEHFAGAMTLMCQSLGLEARLVSGYKISEYNSVGGYFIIRQSDAHAWVEVLVRDGDRDIWKRFDPTSANEAADAPAKTTSFWTRVTHVFDFLEHTWEVNVVAYDATNQSSLLETVDRNVVNASMSATDKIADGRAGWRDWLRELSEKRFSINEAIILTLLTIFTATGVIATLVFIVGRLRLRRRVRRIGLADLDGEEARRLARQLGFYDELIGILQQRQIARPSHLTPLEFGRSLDFLPREAYEIVLRLTQIFYRVRFGEGRLSAGRQRSLGRVVGRLRELLLPEARSN